MIWCEARMILKMEFVVGKADATREGQVCRRLLEPQKKLMRLDFLTALSIHSPMGFLTSGLCAALLSERNYRIQQVSRSQ